MVADRAPDLEELQTLWALVDELGDLSLRLRRAADAALEATSANPPRGNEEEP